MCVELQLNFSLKYCRHGIKLVHSSTSRWNYTQFHSWNEFFIFIDKLWINSSPVTALPHSMKCWLQQDSLKENSLFPYMIFVKGTHPALITLLTMRSVTMNSNDFCFHSIFHNSFLLFSHAALVQHCMCL